VLNNNLIPKFDAAECSGSHPRIIRLPEDIYHRKGRNRLNILHGVRTHAIMICFFIELRIGSLHTVGRTAVQMFFFRDSDFLYFRSYEGI
jgi:hypothetical protein